jgi:flagellar biosynthesis/type III secretory pathway M-ring protein FliF/YscJ
MKAVLKWWRERSTQEKWMIALIGVLIVGIIVRWAWVSDEVAGAFRERFSPSGN